MPTAELEEATDVFDMATALREFMNQLWSLTYTPDDKKRQ